VCEPGGTAIAFFDEIRCQHTSPPSLTVGQVRDLLGRFPVDMAVGVEIAEESGSRFAYDRFAVSGVDRPSVVADGVKSEPNLCVLLADVPAGEYFLLEGGSAVSSTPGRGPLWG
jgi:hypothetical protein